MNIAIGIPCLLRGGTEIQTLQLVKALKTRGLRSSNADVQEPSRQVCEFIVICYFESDPQVVAEFLEAGANLVLLGLDRSITPWNFVSVMANTFRRVKPEVIHIQYMAPGFLAILAARLAWSARIVATVHQPWTLNHHGAKSKILLRAAACICHTFICVSEAAEESWFGASSIYSPGCLGAKDYRSWSSRHFTIHNTIDASRIDQILGSFNSTELRGTLGFGDAIVIGAVSRLSREKGMDLLLEAFALVCSRLPALTDSNNYATHKGIFDKDSSPASSLRVQLLIVGDGQERVRLENQAVALRLYSSNHRDRTFEDQREGGIRGSSVVWFGRRNWEDAIKLMSVMDICVVPSRFEGFGLTAAEAMACGKPVVAADVGGLPEVVGRDNSCGRLYVAESVEGLVQGLTELVLSKQKREALGNRGRVRVESLFGLERFKESIGGLYQELLGE